MELNKSVRILLKDKRLEKFKCGGCLFQDHNPIDHPDALECCTCKDRPNRNKDRSNFVEDFTDEQRERQHQLNIEEQERKGKFDY